MCVRSRRPAGGGQIARSTTTDSNGAGDEYPLKIDFAHPALTTAPGECCSAWELRSPVDRSMRELQPPNEGVALLVAGSSTKDSSTLTLRLYVVWPAYALDDNPAPLLWIYKGVGLRCRTSSASSISLKSPTTHFADPATPEEIYLEPQPRPFEHPRARGPTRSCITNLTVPSMDSTPRPPHSSPLSSASTTSDRPPNSQTDTHTPDPPPTRPPHTPARHLPSRSHTLALGRLARGLRVREVPTARRRAGLGACAVQRGGDFVQRVDRDSVFDSCPGVCVMMKRDARAPTSGDVVGVVVETLASLRRRDTASLWLVFFAQ
ncbi:hypothetical protein VTO73DRAFT_9059 [Trametes versicolor]